MRMAAKTVSFGCVHILVAVTVAYALTGSLAIAIGIGLIEPLVQTVAYFFHEWVWEGRPARRKHSHLITQESL